MMSEGIEGSDKVRQVILTSLNQSVSLFSSYESDTIKELRKQAREDFKFIKGVDNGK